jgi:peptidyl-tRNA hydrolase
MKNSDKYKQIIVTRLDLNLSAGRMAAYVSHGSMAFLTTALRQNARRLDAETVRTVCDFNYGLWTDWLAGSFTKVVVGARDKTAIDELISLAESHGLVEGKDFFPIYEDLSSQLISEEPDGKTLVCVGFRPMMSHEIDPVTRKLRLYT